MKHRLRKYILLCGLVLSLGSVVYAQGSIQYESVATAILGTDDLSITIDRPAGTADRDLLIALITTDANAVISPPVGWTEIHQQKSGLSLGIWWKVADAAEPTTYTFLWDRAEQATGSILRYSGADPVAPVNVFRFNSGRSDQPDAPSDTTTIDSVLVLRVLGMDNDGLPTPLSNIYPSGTNGRFALESNSGTGTTRAAAADHFLANAGATGPAVFSVASPDKFIAGTITIKPPSTVAFASDSSLGSESLNAALEVNLSAPMSATVTVDYAVTGGTATSGGVDYLLFGTGTLTFLPGSVSETIDINVVDDTRYENHETIEVTLSNPVNVTLDPGGPSVHTYTIIENDLFPAIQFSTISSNGSESISPVSLQLELSDLSDFDSKVAYAVSGGTATGGGEDYTLVADTATIAAGATNTTISFAVVDDATDENDETVAVTLTNPVGASLGINTTHTYTINDNDASSVVQFSLASSSSSESATSVDLQLELSASSGQDVTVDYEVTGGDATGSGVDYTLTAGTATILAGDTTTNISVSINDDLLDEADEENVVITLSNPSFAVLGANQSHTYNIQDNDPSPAIEFALANSSGAESVSPASLKLSLSAVSGRNVSVNYAATGGTATGSGVDYTLAAGTATIAAGQDSAIISVSIVGDNRFETAETIEVSLSDPANAVLGTDTVHTRTIVDDDAQPSIQFSLASSSGDEGTSPANLELQLSAVSGLDATVDYAVTGGSATGGGEDYTLAAGTATIAAGNLTTNIPVTVVNDALDELGETIHLQWRRGDVAGQSGTLLICSIRLGCNSGLFCHWRFGNR
jgi:hypothetical protein